MTVRVVVTNDDGIQSPGISTLAAALVRAGYSVMVIAPDHDASGTGAALGQISKSHPVDFTRWNLEGVDAPAYALAGPPALCVVAADREAFGSRPEVVVSGINAGLNPGRSALHSGTVGAALAAQNFGLKGLAVSLQSSGEWHWDTAADLAVDMMPTLLEGPPKSMLNLNVPGIPASEVRGVRWASLAEFGSIRSVVTHVTDDQIHFDYVSSGADFAADTDVATVQAGYAAITSLHGTSEVWQSQSQIGQVLTAGDRVSGASAGHALVPSRAFRPAM